MTIPPVERDERTVAVENAGYRWSYLFLSFGILFVVGARSFWYEQTNWDLLALVVLGGVVNAGYQIQNRVVFRRWIVVTIVTVISAALVAVAVTLIKR